MKKSFIFVSETYFFSIGIGLLISIVIGLPLKLIFTKVNNSLLNFIVDFIVAIICMFIFGFKFGYKSRIFKIKNTLLALLIVFGIIIVFGVVIGSAVYVTGPTDVFATYFFEKTNPDLFYSKEALRDALDWRYSMLFSIIAYIFVYSPIIILAEYLGVKKHIKDFDKLKAQKNK